MRGACDRPGTCARGRPSKIVIRRSLIASGSARDFCGDRRSASLTGCCIRTWPSRRCSALCRVPRGGPTPSFSTESRSGSRSPPPSRDPCRRGVAAVELSFHRTSCRVLASPQRTDRACPLALPRRGSPPVSPGASFDLGPHAVISVGRMVEGERYKGHDEILDAWPGVKRTCSRCPADIRRGGDDVVRLRQKARPWHRSRRPVHRLCSG